MAVRQKNREERQELLIAYLSVHPFANDDELSRWLRVSVPTIRLDRQLLGIPEVRKRVRSVAMGAMQDPTALAAHEIIGEMIDLELNHSAISLMEISEDMVLEKTKIARGHYLFAQANSLAVAVIGAQVVLTSGARLRYKRPVFLHEKITAKAMVKTQRGNTYLVSVHSRVAAEIVFKAQIVLSVQDHKFMKEEGIS